VRDLGQESKTEEIGLRSKKDNHEGTKNTKECTQLQNGVSR
jgi:hypothetical protein